MKANILIFLFIPAWSWAACLSGPMDISPSLKIKGIRQLEESVQKFESEIIRMLPSDLELTISLEPLNPRINAEVVKENSHLAISVWGGMMAHPEMNSSVMTLLLCHEIGHFLGGPPLKSRNGWSSTEGQADYYSTSHCIKKLGMDGEAFIDGALRLTRIYAEVARQAPPTMDRCDTTIVQRINYGYPSVQCRLDTLVAGWNGEVRPRCWYYDGL